MRRRRRKRKSSAGLIVLLLMLAILALLVALRAFDVIGAKQPEPTPFVEEFESGMVIRTEQSPEVESPANTAAPRPSATPTPQPAEESQGAVILEEQGALEILLPEDMESGGF